MMTQAEFQALVMAYQQTNPSPAELEAFREGLIYYVTRDEFSSAESLQLAIDQMEEDQRLEIEDGIAALQNLTRRMRSRLDEVEWEV